MKVTVAVLQVSALGLLVEMSQCQIMSRTLRWETNKRLEDSRTLDDVVFNKHPPIGNAYNYSDLYVEGVHKELYPLLKQDYPIRGHIAYKLKEETYADSPMTPDDFMLRGDELTKYCQWLDTPLYPSSDSKNPYWEALEHVVDIQYYRNQNVHPSRLSTWPRHWESYSLEDIAQAVYSEFPNSEQAITLEYLLNNGDGIEMDHSVMRRRSARDAVGTQFSIAAMNTWVIFAVSPITFLCKWYYGVPRPEEMAFMIFKGKFSEKTEFPISWFEKSRI